MTSKIPTLIVGGGIGGLATALALARHGRPAHVLERAAEFGEIGAGLQLAPNAVHVLEQLGVLPDLNKLAVHPSRLVWMDAVSERKITELDLGNGFKRAYGHPYMVMHRSDLLEVLLAACRAEKLVTLEANRAVQSVEDLGDTARAVCADGDRYEAEILVGADGLRSAVRGLIADDQPIADGYVAYRGTIPMERMSKHAGHDNVVMWVGPDMHFVQYPVRRGELYNQVAVFRSPRYRPGSEDWGTPEELDAHYAQTGDYVRNSIKLMFRDRRWAMYDRRPIDRWSRNRIVLMGDAAHPMYQYIAQGACQAIEDSLCLAKSIAASPYDPLRGIAVYEDARKLRTARVQITARAMGAFFHLDGAAATMRNALVARRAANDYSMIDWLYGHKV
jgi:salicylate hydroxylase